MSLGNYNLRSPGVKRLMREACELADPTEEYFARPLEDNLFEWHFTVRGPPGTDFDGGFYHGRILLPSQYPMQPPNIILLTPNGRFETNKKICLSISGHHPESWQPSWSIRTALLALIAFMPTPANGTIGSLDYPSDDRKRLAFKSKNWECHICGKISEQLSNQTTPKLTKEESSLINEIKLKVEEDSKKTTTEENKSNESLRQRISNNENSTEAIEEDEFIFEDNENLVVIRNSDKPWNIAIGMLISAIVLLIIRRLFFL